MRGALFGSGGPTGAVVLQSCGCRRPGLPHKLRCCAANTPTRTCERPAWARRGGAGASRSLSLNCSPPLGQLPETALPGQLPRSAGVVVLDDLADTCRPGNARQVLCAALVVRPGCGAACAARWTQRAPLQGAPVRRAGAAGDGAAGAAAAQRGGHRGGRPGGRVQAGRSREPGRRVQGGAAARDRRHQRRLPLGARRVRRAAARARQRCGREPCRAPARGPLSVLQARQEAGRTLHAGRARGPRILPRMILVRTLSCSALLHLSTHVAYPCGSPCTAAARTGLVSSRRINEKRRMPCSAAAHAPLRPAERRGSGRRQRRRG